MKNQVVLWSENASDATGIRKQVVSKLKKLKCEARLHYGQKTAVMQPGSENKWFRS